MLDHGRREFLALLGSAAAWPNCRASPAIYDAGSTDFNVRARVDQRADGWTLSRKRVKSRTHVRKPRSTRTKGEARVGPKRAHPAELEKLKARARGLEKKLKTLTRELSDAEEKQTATSEVLSVIQFARQPGACVPACWLRGTS
jgi:hypothetical protein